MGLRFEGEGECGGEYDEQNGFRQTEHNDPSLIIINSNVWRMEFLGFDDNKKIGMFLLMLSALFYFVGVILLFRRSLIMMSNVLFLLGLYFFIGVSGILKFFTKKGKIQGSFVYFGGFLMIVFGWTIFGTIAQIIGFFIIFRSFLPDFYDYICRMPVVGPYLKSYAVQNALDRLAGNNNSRI